RVWRETVAGWEAHLSGDVAIAEHHFYRARERAKEMGFRYVAVSDMGDLPIDDVAVRIRAAIPREGRIHRGDVEAALGTAQKPAIKMSDVTDIFLTLKADQLVGKTEDQIRRFKNPKLKAVNNFIAQCGDLPISEITADDMINFREWWLERIREEGMTANSGNKDLTAISGMLKTINKMKRLGLDLPLSDLAITDNGYTARVPFSDEWIKGKLLAPGALDGLDMQARCILLGMINTGYRPSEGAGLMPHHILLDQEIPMIQIKPEGRHLKNRHSNREIPLVGASLEAFQQCPDGFPMYSGKDKISGVLNRFMKNNGLKETPKTTLYGLRHSFEDRMLRSAVDERVRSDLMGHSIQRQRYGDGGGSEFRHEALLKIAL
ncbi:tyrosine-type recombinase/integrase, partial [Yoonia sp.]|uniref:site-specific integrase n=1 Tax=Yoonia sp. TaxID=2212373 RepID=UPI0023914F75